ncbi:MAG: metallophosphoesterase [Thermodesulfobacteriota bacterium]
MKNWTRREFIVNSGRALVLLGISKGAFNTTRYNLRLETPQVVITGLPAPFKGLKIAQLTDLHSSFIVSEGLLRSAARFVMKEKPDIICLTGDFVTGETKFLSGSVGKFNEKHLEKCVTALEGLSAPMGIYGVLGNHDFWSGKEAVETITEGFSKRLGVVWLRNRSLRLTKGGTAIHLLGVDDYWEDTSSLDDALKGVDEFGVRILLSHNPDINELIELEKLRIDLVISGHTHGGQITLPFIGAPFMPSKFGQKYLAGLVRDGNRQTYISRGVGHLMAPIRLNCPPEATTVITLV